MSRISVTPDELRSQSQVYLTAKEGIQEQIQRVSSMNEQIGEEWNGQAFQAYMGQFSQLLGKVQQFEELLESINHQLNQYATTVEERDANDAGSFKLD